MKIKMLVAGTFLLVLLAGTVVSIAPLPIPPENFVSNVGTISAVSQSAAIGIAKSHIPIESELKKAERIFNKRWAKDVWELEFIDKRGEVHILKVDSDSGETIGYLKGNRNVDRSVEPLALDDAFSKISSFQMPEGYELIEKHAMSPEQYSYKWVRYANGTKVTPDVVFIDYDPYSQEIIGWAVIQHDNLPDTAPKITEKKAMSIAKQYFATRGMTRGDKTTTELEIISDANGELKLAWFVKFIDNLYYAGHWKGVWVDAVNGDVIFYDALS